ncbi:MAG: hypothetical protein OEY14_10890 [Myxococcales bacterium]|nr:hypothetical protein [Myxococcales bacterium]
MSPRGCAAIAGEAQEPLEGTAPPARRWLLLEVPGAWPRDALEAQALPERARASLRALGAQLPGLRVQLLRRPGRSTASPRCFVADSGGDSPWLLELQLGSLEQLPSIDLRAIFEAPEGAGPPPRQRPLHLVCAHGRRDRCCAERGIPVFAALQAHAPDDVWESSHLGGHRFAACVLSLPHGLSYGRVLPAQAEALIDAHLGGELLSLVHLRGRSSLDPWAQAAEIFLRREHGGRSLAGPRHVEIEALDPGEAAPSIARVRLELDGIERSITLRRESMPVTRPPSCGQAPSPAQRFIPQPG